MQQVIEWCNCEGVCNFLVGRNVIISEYVSRRREAVVIQNTYTRVIQVPCGSKQKMGNVEGQHSMLKTPFSTISKTRHIVIILTNSSCPYL